MIYHEYFTFKICPKSKKPLDGVFFPFYAALLDKQKTVRYFKIKLTLTPICTTLHWNTTRSTVLHTALHPNQVTIYTYYNPIKSAIYTYDQYMVNQSPRKENQI